MRFSLACVCLVFFSGTGVSLSADASEAASQWVVSSPGADARWSVGSLHYITWKAPENSTGNRVRIEYSTDSGASWKAVADNARNTGRHLWKVPDSVSTDCSLRISPLEGGPTAQVRFSIIPSQEVPNYQWVNVTTKAAYAPRDGAGALVFKGLMWLLGGWNPNDKVYFPRICNNEVWSSADGARWTLVKPNTFLDDRFDSNSDWEGRHTAGYVVYRGKMWIVGGDANQGHYQNDVWNSEDGKNWNHVNKGRDVPWGPRVLHYTLAFDDKIWVMGGQTIPQIAPEEEVFYRDVWHTTDGVHWVRVQPDEPYWSARGMIGGNVVFKGRMWILGGGTYDTPQTPFRQYYGDIWSSADGVHWTLENEAPPWKPRQYHEVAVFDNRMWVMEGSAEPGVSGKDCWYSADGVNWYELPDTPWIPRHAASVFVHDNALWIAGGSDKGKMDKGVWKVVNRASPSR